MSPQQQAQFVEAVRKLRPEMTGRDVNHIAGSVYDKGVDGLTYDQGRAIYDTIAGEDEIITYQRRDDLRRQYEPAQQNRVKAMFANANSKSPEGVDVNDYLHRQLYEHLGLGSVKDMSVYDVERMIEIYNRGDFVDVAPAGDAAAVWGEDGPPF